jgi:hypothetical protein
LAAAQPDSSLIGFLFPLSFVKGTAHHPTDDDDDDETAHARTHARTKVQMSQLCFSFLGSCSSLLLFAAVS